MKKKNKKKNTYKYDNKRFILVFTMMFCLVISMSTYWMYAYKHKYGKNYFDNKIISYKVSDYVEFNRFTPFNPMYITSFMYSCT